MPSVIKSTLSDNEIISLYFSREERAIEATDEKYGNYLFAVSYNILRDGEDVKECVNDTYLGAWGAIPPARPNSLKAFLTAIIRRLSLNRYDAKRAQKRVPNELIFPLCESYSLSDTDETDLLDEEKQMELAEIISSYLRTLTKRQRYIFMSRFYALEPIDKIADGLSVSRSTVNKEIARIRDGLKSALESEGYKI